MSVLIEFVLGGETPGMDESSFEISACEFTVGEALQRLEESTAQPVLVDEEPVVVEARKQVAAIDVDSMNNVVAFECALELLDVQPELCFRVEPNRVRSTDEVPLALLVADRRSDLPQGLAETATRPRVVELRPEGSRKKVAGMGTLPVEHQIGEQRAGGAEGKLLERPPLPCQFESAEQSDLESGHSAGTVVAGNEVFSPVRSPQSSVLSLQPDSREGWSRGSY